jgi:hypothetical protein
MVSLARTMRSAAACLAGGRRGPLLRKPQRRDVVRDDEHEPYSDADDRRRQAEAGQRTSHPPRME